MSQNSVITKLEAHIRLNPSLRETTQHTNKFSKLPTTVQLGNEDMQSEPTQHSVVKNKKNTPVDKNNELKSEEERLRLTLSTTQGEYPKKPDIIPTEKKEVEKKFVEFVMKRTVLYKNSKLQHGKELQLGEVKHQTTYFVPEGHHEVAIFVNCKQEDLELSDDSADDLDGKEKSASEEETSEKRTEGYYFFENTTLTTTQLPIEENTIYRYQLETEHVVYFPADVRFKIYWGYLKDI